MKILLVIGAGSFIGGVSRYWISQLIQNRFLSTFPFGTMGVNIMGCFLIGLLFALSEKANLGAEWRMFLVTGMLGGFTTFSSFSNETVAMLRDGQLTYAITYVGVSVIFGLLATMIGISIIKLF